MAQAPPGTPIPVPRLIVEAIEDYEVARQDDRHAGKADAEGARRRLVRAERQLIELLSLYRRDVVVDGWRYSTDGADLYRWPWGKKGAK